MVEGPSREHKQLILTADMYLQYHDCIGSSIRIILFFIEVNYKKIIFIISNSSGDL